MRRRTGAKSDTAPVYPQGGIQLALSVVKAAVVIASFMRARSAAVSGLLASLTGNKKIARR